MEIEKTKEHVIEKEFKDIQIIFDIKDIKAKEEINKIIFYLIGEKRSTKISQMDTYYIYHYNALIESHELNAFKKHENLKKRFSKLITSITISDAIQIPLNILSDSEKKEITYTELMNIIHAFIKIITASYLEVILSRTILSSRDSKLTKEEVEDFNLDDNLKPLRTLIVKHQVLGISDIKKIFNLIDDMDDLLRRQLFYLMMKKHALKDITSFYEVITGKTLSFDDKHGFEESTEESIKLEVFFRAYIQLHGILENVIEQVGKSKEVIEIQIPINPLSYEFDKQYNTGVAEFLTKCFHEKGNVVLKAFKTVLEHEAKMHKDLTLENLIVSFEIKDDSKELMKMLRKKGIYYDQVQLALMEIYGKRRPLLKERDKKEVVELRTFIIFKGYYQEDKNSITSWDRQFKIRDPDGYDLKCRIRENKECFKSLHLDMETEIEIQATYYEKYRYDVRKEFWQPETRYFDIIAIKILDRFESISVNLGQDFQGKRILENTREGIILYKHSENGKLMHEKILDVPLILQKVFRGENSLFYRVKLGTKVITKPKADICLYIEEDTNLAFQTGLILKNAINNIMREYRKKRNMPILQMFYTVGVFIDENRELIVSDPFDDKISVSGNNDMQDDVIDMIKAKGIDKKGELLECFYKILHVQTMREDVRLGVFGYASINPFLFAIKDAIDVFPNLFIIGIAGSGKTTFLELMMNIMYGTKLKSPDSIDSTARLTKYSTESTFPLNIDDIDILDPKLMNYIKTNSTRKTTRDRMTKDQRKNSEQTYTCYTGSANKKEFLLGNKNEAFRKRCLVFEIMKKIDMKDETREFEEQREIIKKGKVFGFYLLKKTVEFIDKSNEKDISVYFKLVAMLNTTKRELKNCFLDNDVPLTDIRRLTIYALVWIGWRIWQHVFNERGLKSELLDSVLDLKSGRFLAFVNNLENVERSIGLEVFDNILAFYEEKNDEFKNLIPDARALSRTNGESEYPVVVLNARFINAYDEWARRRGYDTLGSIVKMGELQSELLNREIKPKSIRYTDISNSHAKCNKYSILFYYKEIKEMRRSLSSTDDDVIEEELEGDFDIDEILAGKPENLANETIESLEKTKIILEKLDNIFNDNGSIALKKEDVIQVLELEESLEGIAVEKYINLLIEDSVILKENGMIRLNKSITNDRD